MIHYTLRVTIEVAGVSPPRNLRKTSKGDIGSCETLVHNLITTLVVSNLEKRPLIQIHIEIAHKSV